MKTDQICSACGELIKNETVHKFNGNVYCDECFMRKTTVCDCCGERIFRANAEGDDYTTLCHHCYEYCYSTCESCGMLIHNDSAYYEEDSDVPYCQECFERLQGHAIKSYGYKPEPIFYGSGNLFIGVELEIDKGGEDNSYAEQILNVCNTDDTYIYAKHDGSIENGFEIVSHPMTLDYHLNQMNWDEIFEKAISIGYRSHNTSTCGLHCHINRNAFGKDFDEQEMVVGKIVYFVEKHWNEIVKFSRRTEENLNRWAARYATISNTTEETYKKAKDKRMGRYVAVNLENYETIEFRLFRGTLYYKTFAATLQLVEEICNICKLLTDKEIERLTWGDFVASIKDKPELIDYLKSKRLYINEMTRLEEEV